MTDGTNPEGGVTDFDSAVESLIAPRKEASEPEETEAAQEPQEDAEPETAEAEAPAEGEDDSGDEPDDSAEEAEETDDDPKYTVKVDGEEFEVNLSELINGYQKGADYHRKTTAVAEDKRALAAEKQQVNELRERLTAGLAELAERMGNEPEPDWVKLSQELDPWEYQKQRAEYDAKAASKAHTRQQAQALQAYQHAQMLQEQRAKLVERFPEWKDPKVFNAARDEMREAAKSYGFTEQEFMGALDHRVFVMLQDAMRGRKVAAAVKKPPVEKKVAKPPVKVLKPGAKETSATRKGRETDALRNNLRKRGDIDSAVDFILGVR